MGPWQDSGQQQGGPRGVGRHAGVALGRVESPAGTLTELSAGLMLTTQPAAAGAGRPPLSGAPPAHPGVPPPLWPLGVSPGFPSQAVDLRTGHTFRGLWGRSQSEPSVLGTWREPPPAPITRGLGGQQAQASPALQPRHSDPGPGPGWRTLTAQETVFRTSPDTHLFLFKVGELRS